ncbi:MAG: hypothetical protein SGJ20_20490 [Planctomycetota bacterium]|nr:hypothetical protein [Planctomycetota bacterium]
MFAILTQGPFPSGQATDIAVELHLAHCSECRRIAEALRPIEPLSGIESVDIPETLKLPGYRGDHREWSYEVEDGPNSLSNSRNARRPSPYGPQGLYLPTGHGAAVPPALGSGRFAAAMILGIVIGTVWCTIMIPRSTAPGGSLVATTSPVSTASIASVAGFKFWDNQPRLHDNLISGLMLPAACRTIELRSFVPPADDVQRISNVGGASPTDMIGQCCTQCHAASGSKTKLNEHARELVISSCTICHSNSVGLSRQ